MAIEIRIGTRSSQLASWQTNHVKAGLERRFPDISITVETIKTTGDKILDAPLAKIGDRGIFTKELEFALLDGRIDCAVHSLKDIPTTIHEGLAIVAVLEREDVHDVFISHPKKSYRHWNDIPPGAALATGSLRRKCQLLSARPDLHIIDIRGNLNSRMRKLEESNWDGMILAQAGVKRLGWTDNITEILSFELMLPAVGQGALAIEARTGDGRIAEMLRVLHHKPTAIATAAERSLLRRLEGGCQIPIGAYAMIREDTVRIDAVIGSLDGKRVVRGTKAAPVAEAEKAGIELAEELMRLGGNEILEEIRSSTGT
jgi:hydroxymethylbilane synthase